MMMEQLNLFPGFALLICAALYSGISLPLLKGSVKMNIWYGFRIKKAFDSEENWYKINQYGARELIRWSIVLIAIAAIAFFLPLQNNIVLTIIISLAPLIVIIPVIIKTYRLAKGL